MGLIDNQLEPIVLRESINARTSVVPISVPATVLTIALFVPFLISQGAEVVGMSLWVGLLVVLMAGRGVLSKRISARLDDMSDNELHRADWILRISSILNQSTVGAGIWLVNSPDAVYPVLHLYVTVLVSIWALGTLSNLFSDRLSFEMSMPLLMGQPALFWLLQGGIGISIGIGMLLTMVLMILLVRRGSQVFRDSILMRFEKDNLLHQVEEEQRKTQEALRDAQAANEAKDFFMAAAGHDIKQPLYALSMLTDTLLMSDPPESVVPILKNQKASIAQMSEHFETLMDMSKFHDGSFRIRLAPVPLKDFASRIDREIAPMCAAKALTWCLQMEDVSVVADEELLLRLMRNLLINAVRYTQTGEVSCTAKANGELVNFNITDTGCGIPPEHQQDVFKEFVRLSHEEQSSMGAGLGLSIVRKIDRALRLSLKMKSRVGEGTQFDFHLPREKSETISQSGAAVST